MRIVRYCRKCREQTFWVRTVINIVMCSECGYEEEE